MVDDEHFDFLNQYNWHVAPSRKTFYAQRHGIKRLGEKATISMHREILKLKNGKIQVDHIDGDGLNNQKSNLRLCDHKQNQHNSLKQDGCTSKFKGVSWSPIMKKWRVSFGPSSNRKTIGHYESEKEAALAYNVTASFAYREFAKLNVI